VRPAHALELDRGERSVEVRGRQHDRARTGLFAWISTRAEQAAAEGMDTETALRLTGDDPEPWDSGAVVSVLPEIGELKDIDWSKPVMSWPKDMVVRFLLGAMPLVQRAMVARDVGGAWQDKRRLGARAGACSR